LARSNTRKTFLSLHRYLGLLVGLVVIVISLTGAILVFENEIDQILYPALWHVAPHGSPLPLNALIESVRAVHPEDRLEWIDIDTSPDNSYVMHTISRRQIFVNPYSAEILGERDYDKTFFGMIFFLHRTLLAGEVGRTVVGVTTLVVVFLLVTGLYLWWPRAFGRLKPSLYIKWTNGERRLTYDLHNVLGFYASWYVIVIAVTGLVWSFPVVNDAIFWLTDSPPPPWKSAPRSKAAAGTAPFSADEALHAAALALPGAHATEIILPQQPDDPYAIVKRFPRRGNPNAQSQIYVDQYGGAVLAVERYEELSLGATIRLLVYPIHVGTVFGLPTQILAFLVSMVIPLSAVTGFFLWWRKRTPSRGSGAA
jgi:uncharacterized iron-regulated membrane protein